LPDPVPSILIKNKEALCLLDSVGIVKDRVRSEHGEFILTVNPSISGPQGVKLFYHEEHEEHEDSLPSWFFKKIILAHFKAAAEKNQQGMAFFFISNRITLPCRSESTGDTLFGQIRADLGIQYLIVCRMFCLHVQGEH